MIVDGFDLVRAGTPEAAVSGWAGAGLSSAAAILIVLRVVCVPDGRRGWGLMAGGVVVYAMGDLAYALGTQTGAETGGLPNALWLLHFPLLYAGMVVLLRPRVRGLPATAWLDGLIAVGSTTLLAAVLLLPATVAGGEGGVAAVSAGALFILADILLVGMAVVPLVLFAARPGPAWSVLITSLIVYASADGLYGWMTAEGTWRDGTPVDSLWALALVLLALAAWLPDRPAPRRRPTGSRQLILPSAFALVAICVLAQGAIKGYAPPLAITIAVITLLLVLLRMIITVRENQRLTLGLEEAVAAAEADPLTGLLNHRAFHERLARSVERALGREEPLALVLVDLDEFKRINDVHGHQVGDGVLCEVARQMRLLTRKGDAVARIGGEEFAWVLAGTNAAEAHAGAERLRAAVAACSLPGDVGGVTVSAGVADLDDSSDPGELVRLADGALYWAKAHGRDVCIRYAAGVIEHLSADDRAEHLERRQALSAIRSLARAVDAKDANTSRHSERVADLVAELAREMGWEQTRVELLRDAGLVHDVGKIGVPDAVLTKPGRLTDEEYEQVKGHAALGAAIVAEVLGDEQVAWVRHHHERWDGAGYPDAIAGEDIPEGARLMAVADAFDAMTGVRNYRSALTAEEAMAELVDGAGRQWWSEAVEAMLRTRGIPDARAGSSGLPPEAETRPA